MSNVEQTANTVVSEQQRLINQLRESEAMMKSQAESHLQSLTLRAESQHALYEVHAAQMQRRLELMTSELAMANRNSVAHAASNGEANRTTNPGSVAHAASHGGVNRTGYVSPKSRSISSSVRQQDVSRLESMFERLMNRMDDDSKARERSQLDLANTLWSIEERLTFVETNPVMPTVEVAHAASSGGSPKRKDKLNITYLDSKGSVAHAATSKDSKSGKDKTIGKSEFEHLMQKGSTGSSAHPSTFDRIYKSDDPRKTKSGGGNDPDPDDEGSDEDDGKPDDRDRKPRRQPRDPSDDPDDEGDEDGDDEDDDDDRPRRTTGPNHDDRDEQAKRFMKSLLSNASRSRTKEADVIKLVSLPEPAQFRAWRHSTRSKAVAASNNPEAAFKWIK
jgi:hypothetical protein